MALMCLCAVAQTVTHTLSIQNAPNPFSGTTSVWLTTVEEGAVTLEIRDMNGRSIVGMPYYDIPTGRHEFRVTLSVAGTYILTARQNGQMASVKMVNHGGGNRDAIVYLGSSSVSAGMVPPETVHAPSLQTYDSNDQSGFGGNVDFADLQPADTLPVVEGDKEEKKGRTVENSDFRVALSLSPFSLNQFQQGYTFTVGHSTATTPQELQNIYRELGSTEMYVRIATKRHVTAENTVDGVEDENANVHTFDQGIELCRIAAELGIPINPEIMCAYTYMDMMVSQGPRFEEYPEIYALQNGKRWEELTLDEICVVLEAYGAFVAEAILSTGCTVNNWNLGNEANFCFAGIGIGAETAVDPKLAKAGTLKRYLASVFSTWWLKKHVWQYDAKAYAAVKNGILSAYAKLGISDSTVRFSTHIATVVFPPKCSVKFFNYMKDNGYEMDVAGISYYPSAPAMSANKKKLLKKTVTKINKKCGLPVFIGEFSYPSGKMEGPFAGWNKKVRGYKHTQQGQADIYADVMAWGKDNGLEGIRYWAPDYEGWYSMSMFEFSDKKGTAKYILQHHKELMER